MTTLTCLVAWLFLYLFAVSSLSLCSINRDSREDAKDGHAIGESDQPPANIKNPNGEIEMHLSTDEVVKEEKVGGITENQHQQDSTKQKNSGVLSSETVYQDVQNEPPIDPKPSPREQKHDQDESREKDIVIPDDDDSPTDNDPMPVNNDMDGSSEDGLIKQDISGDNEITEDVEEDSQQRELAQAEAEEDEIDKSEEKHLDGDPNQDQESSAEDISTDTTKEPDPGEKSVDAKTEVVDENTEEEGANVSADDSHLADNLEEIRTDDKKDILKEQPSMETFEETGERKLPGTGEDEGEEIEIDQQIDEEIAGDNVVEQKDEEEKKTKERGKEEETEPEEKGGEKSLDVKRGLDEKDKETMDDKDEELKQDQEDKTEDEKRSEVDSGEGIKPTEEETKSNATDHDVIKTDEMPSYDEWREKKLQQAKEDFDRELGQGERNPAPAPKFNLNENSKNHASADCGSKILGTNPEAQSPSAILNSNRDIYMINPCSAKSIWFTVELCEPIQVKLIELANYELFSCVPESFKVSISDRYPVREWHQLGTFVARDERSLQNFPLNEETMFAKYMRIEMLTFFGSEHFCPLSVLRVFGTSMVEEIDDAEGVDSASSTEQDVLPVHPTPLPEDLKGNGILDHAKDAVFKLVEKAAKVLTGSKSDGEADTDKSADDIGEEMPMDRNFSDGKVKEDGTQGSDKESEPHNDRCNGQEVCFQENYATASQHCCFSLLAQAAGSILLCCKALKQRPKPIKPGGETVEETSNLLLPSQVPMEVIQTKIEDTKDKIEASIQTSIVLEPTPPDIYHGEDKKIESSSPPSIVFPSTDVARPIKSSRSEILATKTKTKQILHTSLDQTQNMMDVGGEINRLPSEDKENKSEISVEPKPVPLLKDSVTEEKTKSKNKSIDVEVASASESNKSTNISHDVPPIETITRPESEEKEQPPVQTSDKDAIKVNAAVGTTKPSSQQIAKSEIDSNVSEELEDKGSPPVADTIKEENGANTTNKIQESKREVNESTKVTQPSTLGEKPTSLANNSKSTAAAADVGNGSFSPSASSLGSLPHGVQKESVLMRLNNRIKTLEINMSLSGLYLEELSQRYRKQMDEMQKAFNTKIKNVQDNAQKAQELRQQQVEYIQQLEKKLEKMTTDLENVTHRMDGILREVVERHLFLMLCEVVVMVIVFSYCLRRSSSQSSHGINTSVGMATKSSGKKPVEETGRRNSDGLLHVPMRDKISLSPGLGPGLGFMKDVGKTGSLDDLLIIGPTTPLREALRQASEPSKQRNRHKNKGRNKNSQRPASAASATSTESVPQDLVSSSSNSSIASSFSLSSTSSTKGLSSSATSKQSTSGPSTSGNRGLPSAANSRHSTAGLLFRGSAPVKKGSQGGMGGHQQPQRDVPENIGQMNGEYQGHAGGGGGGKKNNQCINGYSKR
ncbi:SUN domain-containing ossification factor-like [Lytechinus variegatus]|uniref:SUN domain-containing ossification factor-like n=1 Tax=Lytechinus variegatus TaxID=7654 RepID=UPI001BB274D7|nr:SUN domain-containing ossification factor-like [Lytechinus variegatus]